MIGFLFAFIALHSKSCKTEGCVNLRYVRVVYNKFGVFLALQNVRKCGTLLIISKCRKKILHSCPVCSLWIWGYKSLLVRPDDTYSKTHYTYATINYSNIK